MGTFVKSNFVSTDTTAPRVRGPYAVDTFTRPDAVGLGKTETGGYAWVTSVGGNNTGSIVSNTAQLSNTAGGGTARIDDGKVDGVVSVRLVDFTLSAGLCFRGTVGKDGEYGIYADAGLYRFARKTGPDAYSGNAVLANSPVPAKGDVLSVEMNGSLFTIRVNGALVTTITDTAYTGTTKGLFTRATTSRFDNFRSDPLP